MTSCEVAIVGAGLAGLACALTLQAQGVDAQLFEASDAPGGRVRTDAVDGFLLDRGFQVYLDAYPEGRRFFDHGALDLRAYEPGAMVRRDGRTWRIADPIRRPGMALETALAGIGTLGDKLAVGRMRLRVTATSLADLMRRPETTAAEALRRRGFSGTMIDSFFRPFLGGILLGRDLQTSSRMMDFALRMTALGNTTTPAAGMGALPVQLAARLRPGTLHVDTPVECVDGGVVLAGGERVRAGRVVVAAEGPAAARLLGGKVADPGSRGVTCLYFAADQSPVDGPWLVLNGEREALVNNLTVPSEVSPGYAPARRALVGATVIGIPAIDDARLVRLVKSELRGWYGSAVDRWEHLRTYRIPHAQPEQAPGFLMRRSPVLRNGTTVICAGDYLDTASINGALRSGRKAGKFLLTSGQKEVARS